MSEEVESVTLPGSDGVLTVLAHHTHIITSLDRGEVRIAKKDAEGNAKVTSVRIEHGVAEMSREGKLTVFTATAEVQ